MKQIIFLLLIYGSVEAQTFIVHPPPPQIGYYYDPGYLGYGIRIVMPDNSVVVPGLPGWRPFIPPPVGVLPQVPHENINFNSSHTDWLRRILDSGALKKP